MVLEALLDPRKAEREPWELFFLGVLYSSFALLLSFWVFKGHISIVMIALTSICSVPFVYNIIKFEAAKDIEIADEGRLLKEHGKAIAALTFLFLGFVASFLFWFCALPSASVQNAFSAQIATISEINVLPAASVVDVGRSLGNIMLNNVKILLFCFLFSFFFGAGAIFILTWNASVLAAAVGLFVRNKLLAKVASGAVAYSQFISAGLLKYLLHGIPEIMSYFVGGLAGGIVSIAAIRYDYKSKEFKKTLLDALDILAISIIILIVAGLMEVFLSPKIF